MWLGNIVRKKCHSKYLGGIFPSSGIFESIFYAYWHHIESVVSSQGKLKKSLRFLCFLNDSKLYRFFLTYYAMMRVLA